jgi:hypothetical protein
MYRLKYIVISPYSPELNHERGDDDGIRQKTFSYVARSRENEIIII